MTALLEKPVSERNDLGPLRGKGRVHEEERELHRECEVEGDDEAAGGQACGRELHFALVATDALGAAPLSLDNTRAGMASQEEGLLHFPHLDGDFANLASKASYLPTA
ncbi:MAG: hypothetical protein O6949_01380 [Chloroflexi bacterium]|nr:hypothetical protein [Chloroflexota bacterium]